MKFGLHLTVSPRHYREIASLAEEVGFDTIYVPEHLVLPSEMPALYPYSDDGLPRLSGLGDITPSTPCYDPWAQLGFVAACTSTVRLATAVAVVPLYHPLFLARSLATLDRLSGGRVTLGGGVGWLKSEFDWAGRSFHDRGRRTDVIIDLLRRFWAEDVVEHHDEHFDLGPLQFNPKPLQKPGIPIELGGSSPAALRRVGRLGDGWLEFGARDLDEVVAQLAVVDEERRRAERTELPFEVTSWLPVIDDVDRVRRAEDAGIDRIATSPTVANGTPLTPDVFRTWAFALRDRMSSLESSGLTS